MYSMDDYVLDYLSSVFTPEEKEFIYTPSDKIFILWKDLTDKYKKLLPFSHLDYYTLNTASSCTELIQKLFKKHVDNDTFVVSSNYEHDSTRKCLEKVQNKLILHYAEDIIKLNTDKIITEYKKSGCKRLFAYFIGTGLSTGEILPQIFFIKLKKACLDNNIEHVMVLDDVHGMFITPRDYSIFDYIMYTCHSWIKDYEMGMMWSKTDCGGIQDFDKAKDYLNKLHIVISKFDKIRQFKLVLSQFFAEELANKATFNLFDNTTQHIFTLETHGLAFTQEDYNTLNRYLIKISEYNSIDNFIRIRFQELISFDPEFALEGLHAVKKILKKAVFLKNSSGVIPIFDDSKYIKTDYI